MITAVMAALVPAFFAYGGWQHALWISGEVREPRTTLPRAIVGGVVLVVIVYLLANWAYLRLLGAEGVAGSEALASDATAVVLPGAGRRLIAAAVAISAFGVLNAQLLSGPRLVYGMAREGQFFSVFGRLSPRFGTPVACIVLLSTMAAALLLADTAFELVMEAGSAPGADGEAKTPIDRLLTGVVFIDGVFFGLTGAALFVLRRRSAPGTAGPPLRVIGYPIVPGLFVAGELALVAGSFIEGDTRVAAVAGVGWIALAFALYWACFRRE
jgi:APA family basic amino acid/polyamine antiporter